MSVEKILIADDSEMNRMILTDMLEDEYEIIEAVNGLEAVEALYKYGTGISLVLLDIVMPEMDGFGVLTMMNQSGWIEDIPVIMISAESGGEHVQRAYDLGATDFISRPFDAMIVHKRVVNTLMLYAKQKKLIGMVEEQLYEKEKSSKLMINILSHIVEFRNGESGLHVLHVQTLTELLLRALAHKTDRYGLTEEDVKLIGMASALHDIGKIAIDEKVLNKPGRLTDEEYEIIKQHAAIGEQMLKDVPFHQDEPIVKIASEICRWHHERYDGRGYPDGLKGDEIPISAQIVALADVYDALTSERVYKAAYSSETAVQMIADGQCGSFNPLVLECLTDIAPTIPEKMAATSDQTEPRELHEAVEALMKREELAVSERTNQLYEYERRKSGFYADMSEELQFEYAAATSILTLPPKSARKLELPEVLLNPMSNSRIQELLGEEGIRKLLSMKEGSTPENPQFQFDFSAVYDGEEHEGRITARTMWSEENPPRYTGMIGKVIEGG